MINRNQYYYKIMLTDNASGRLLFEDNIHRLEVTDGRFHCWDFGYFILLDHDGEEISRVKVKYGRSG